MRTCGKSWTDEPECPRNCPWWEWPLCYDPLRFILWAEIRFKLLFTNKNIYMRVNHGNKSFPKYWLFITYVSVVPGAPGLIYDGHAFEWVFKKYKVCKSCKKLFMTKLCASSGMRSHVWIKDSRRVKNWMMLSDFGQLIVQVLHRRITSEWTECAKNQPWSLICEIIWANTVT